MDPGAEEKTVLQARRASRVEGWYEEEKDLTRGGRRREPRRGAAPLVEERGGRGRELSLSPQGGAGALEEEGQLAGPARVEERGFIRDRVRTSLKDRGEPPRPQRPGSAYRLWKCIN